MALLHPALQLHHFGQVSPSEGWHVMSKVFLLVAAAAAAAAVVVVVVVGGGGVVVVGGGGGDFDGKKSIQFLDVA